jgi:vacuolar-type H+-ATPase subunit E/Vma4
MSLSSVSKGLLGIAKEVLEDVEKEAESIILEAGSQAEKILEEAEKDAGGRYKSIVKEGEEKIEAERKEKTILFEIEAKNSLLQAQEKVIDEVFEKASSRLREYASTKKYQDCLSKLIIDACKKMNADKLVIQLNQNDFSTMTEERLEKLSKELGVKLVKSDKPINVIGGVIVKSSDGKIVVNNTFENRLNMLRSNLRVKIANILFREESKSKPKGQSSV